MQCGTDVVMASYQGVYIFFVVVVVIWIQNQFRFIHEKRTFVISSKVVITISTQFYCLPFVPYIYL